VAQQRGPEAQQLRQLLQAYAAAAKGQQQQQAVLSLVLALQGGCPRPAPVMTALPPLGSSAIHQLEQRAASAAAAVRDEPGGANGSSSSSSTTRSWLSPAAAALDLLQAVPLDASAIAQPPGLSTATRQPAAATAHGRKQQRPASGPLVDLINRSMLLASQDSCLKQPLRLQALQLGSSKPGASAATAGRSSSSSSRDMDSTRRNSSSTVDAASRGGSAVSAAATVAEAATAALAGVEPGVLPLMHLASAQPSESHQLGGLRGSSQDDSSSRRSTQAGEGQPPAAIRYTALSRQPSSSSGGSGGLSRRSTIDSSRGVPYSTATDMPPGSKQQPAQPRHDTGACRDQGTPPPAAAAAVLHATSNASAEGELVSVACLAVQGVWAAVGQLWQLAVGSEPGGAHHR
jgi:hypothetical protein